jgi:hypothetical protein
MPCFVCPQTARATGAVLAESCGELAMQRRLDGGY